MDPDRRPNRIEFGGKQSTLDGQPYLAGLLYVFSIVPYTVAFVLFVIVVVHNLKSP